jgi:hypothetical protein
MALINHAHIEILGPDHHGAFVVEFWKHTGARLAFVVLANADNDVLDYFQQRMPYGLAVPDLETPVGAADRGTMRRRLRPPR